MCCRGSEQHRINWLGQVGKGLIAALGGADSDDDEDAEENEADGAATEMESLLSTENIEHTLGRVVGVATAGLAQLLRVRAVVEREFDEVVEAAGALDYKAWQYTQPTPHHTPTSTRLDESDSARVPDDGVADWPQPLGLMALQGGFDGLKAAVSTALQVRRGACNHLYAPLCMHSSITVPS